MSYIKPGVNSRQTIFMDVNGNVHQVLVDEPGTPKILYKGDRQGVNEAMALMTALDDFLTSQGIEVSKTRKLLERERKLRFNGETWHEIRDELEPNG